MKIFLPFNLKTIKAVETIADRKDTRFDTWFDVLQYMYDEAIKIDFDVGIIDCGAYGFPLSAMLKNRETGYSLGRSNTSSFWNQRQEMGVKRKLWLSTSVV